jgi:hypothetical protein
MYSVYFSVDFRRDRCRLPGRRRAGYPRAGPAQHPECSLNRSHVVAIQEEPPASGTSPGTSPPSSPPARCPAARSAAIGGHRDRRPASRTGLPFSHAGGPGGCRAQVDPVDRPQPRPGSASRSPGPHRDRHCCADCQPAGPGSGQPYQRPIQGTCRETCRHRAHPRPPPCDPGKPRVRVLAITASAVSRSWSCCRRGRGHRRRTPPRARPTCRGRNMPSPGRDAATRAAAADRVHQSLTCPRLYWSGCPAGGLRERFAKSCAADQRPARHDGACRD